MQHQPRLSIVIVLYDMAREAERSLYALSAAYQRGVCAKDYEVIVVENGSPAPVLRETVQAFGPNFRYLGIPHGQAKPSPAAALNAGAALSGGGAYLGMMIDGARIASPGAVAGAIEALSRFDRAVAVTVGLHLGPAMQTRAAETGYDQAEEDRLLQSIDWRGNGYALFNISVLTGVNARGWFGPMSESNLIFLPRALYDEIGGFDERFEEPGGGIVNLDFYNRASQAEGVTLLSLFGEATFHQIHGGVMSSRSAETVPNEVARYMAQYLRIKGEPYQASRDMPILLGRFRPELASCIRASEPRWNPGG